MRNFNSSFTIWILITLAFLVWHSCHSYPDSREYRNPDHLIQKDVSSKNSEYVAAIDSTHRLHSPIMEQTHYQIWHPEKRHIDENPSKSKSLSPWPISPVKTAVSRSPISQIIKQFMPSTATRSQQDEICKCIDDATTELQNILNQFKTACINIRDSFSVGPPKNSTPSTCQNPNFMESAPILIQNLIENPEQITQIPEILQSSMPYSEMSDSVDKLKDSLQNIFGLLQKINSEERDYQQKQNNEKQPLGKNKILEKINKKLQCWQEKKSCENRKCNDPNCDKCSLNEVPNTMILTMPNTMPVALPASALSLEPALTQSLPLDLVSTLTASSNSDPSTVLTSLSPSVLNSKFNSVTDLVSTPVFTITSTSNSPQISDTDIASTSQINLVPDITLTRQLAAPSVSNLPLTTPSSSYLIPLSNLVINPALNPSIISNSSSILISNSTKTSTLNLPSKKTLNSTSIIEADSVVDLPLSPTSTLLVSKVSTPLSPSALRTGLITYLNAVNNPSTNQHSASSLHSTSIPLSPNTFRNLAPVNDFHESTFPQFSNKYPNYSENSNSASNSIHLSNNYPNYYDTSSSFGYNGNYDSLNYSDHFDSSEYIRHQNHSSNSGFPSQNNYPYYINYSKYFEKPETVPLFLEKNIDKLSSISSKSNTPTISSILCTESETELPIAKLLSSIKSPTLITLNPNLSINKLQSSGTTINTEMKSADLFDENTKPKILPTTIHKSSVSKQDLLKSKVSRLLSLFNSKSSNSAIESKLESQPNLKSITEPYLLSVISTDSALPLYNLTVQEQYISSTSNPCIQPTAEPYISPIPESHIPTTLESLAPSISETCASPTPESGISSVLKPINLSIPELYVPTEANTSIISVKPELFAATLPELYSLPMQKPQYPFESKSYFSSSSEPCIAPIIKTNIPFASKLSNLKTDQPLLTKKSSCFHKTNEHKKSMGLEFSKRNSKFDSFLIPKHVIQRSAESKCMRCPNSRSLHYINQPNRTSAQILQINVPPTSKVYQTQSIIPNQSITSSLSNPTGQIISVISPSINSLKSTLDQLFPNNSFASINSEIPLHFSKFPEQNNNYNESDRYNSDQIQSWYANSSPSNEYSNILSKNTYENVPLHIKQSNGSWKNKYPNLGWLRTNSNIPSQTEYYNSQNENYYTSWQSQYPNLFWQGNNYITPTQSRTSNTQLLSKHPTFSSHNKIPWYNRKFNVLSQNIMPNITFKNEYFNNILKTENSTSPNLTGYSNNDCQVMNLNVDPENLNSQNSNLSKFEHSNVYSQGVGVNTHWNTDNPNILTQNEYKALSPNKYPDNFSLSQNYFNLALLGNDVNIAQKSKFPSLTSKNSNLSIQPKNINSNIDLSSERSNFVWQNENSKNLLESKNLNMKSQNSQQANNLNFPVENTYFNIDNKNGMTNTNPKIVNDISYDIVQNKNFRTPSEKEYFNIDSHNENSNVSWHEKNYKTLSQDQYLHSIMPNVNLDNSLHKKDSVASWKFGKTNVPRLSKNTKTFQNENPDISSQGITFNFPFKPIASIASERDEYSKVPWESIYSNITWKEKNPNFPLLQKNFVIPSAHNTHSQSKTFSIPWQLGNSNKPILNENYVNNQTSPYLNKYSNINWQAGITNTPFQNENLNNSKQSKNQNNLSESITNNSLHNNNSKSVVTTNGYINNPIQGQNLNSLPHDKNIKISEIENTNIDSQDDHLKNSLQPINLDNVSQDLISNALLKNKYSDSKFDSKYFNTENENLDSSSQNKNHIPFHSTNFDIIQHSEESNTSPKNLHPNSSKHEYFTSLSPPIRTDVSSKFRKENILPLNDYNSDSSHNFNPSTGTDISFQNIKENTLPISDYNSNSSHHTYSSVPLQYVHNDASLQGLNPNNIYKNKLPYKSSETIYPNIPTPNIKPEKLLQNKNISIVPQIQNSNFFSDLKNEDNSLQNKKLDLSYQNKFFSTPIQDKFSKSNLKNENNNPYNFEYPHIHLKNENFNSNIQNINSNLTLKNRNSNTLSRNKSYYIPIRDNSINESFRPVNENHKYESSYSSTASENIYPNKIKLNIDKNTSSQKDYTNVLSRSNNIYTNIAGKNNDNIISDASNNVLPQNRNSNIAFKDLDQNSYFKNQYHSTILHMKKPEKILPTENIDPLNQNRHLYNTFKTKLSDTSTEGINNTQTSSEYVTFKSFEGENSDVPSQNIYLNIPSLSKDINSSIETRYPLSQLQISNFSWPNRYFNADFKTEHPRVSIENQFSDGTTQIVNPINSTHNLYSGLLENDQFEELQVQNYSPSDRLGSTTSVVGDALNIISSLIAPDTLNNKSTLETLGSTASTVADIISEASSLIASDSKKKEFPIKTFGITVPTVGDTINEASAFITPKSLNKEQPLQQITNTATSMLNVFAGTPSSLLIPESSQNITHKVKINQSDIFNDAVSTLANSVATVDSLLNSNSQLYNTQHYLNNKITNDPKKFNSLQAEYSTIIDKVNSEESVGVPLQKLRTKTNSLSKSTSFTPESVTSVIANSVISMANSASIVANSLSSAVSQLTLQNQQKIDTLYVPSSTASATLIVPPQSIAHGTDGPSSSILQNVFLYGPTSRTDIQRDDQIFLALPRDKISAAINGGIVLPGDVITIALNNQRALVGKVIDFKSPISFNLIKRNNRESLPLQGNHNWIISSKDCKDGELQNILQQVSTNIIVP